MGKSSGGGSQTTTALPSPQQAPYLSDIYRQAQARYNQGPQQFFPGQTYAGLTEDMEVAEQQLRANLVPQQALADNIAAAQNYSLMSPQNLASNPYLAGAAEAALRPIYSQAQGLLQQARRDATGAGQLGGTRQAILEQGVIGDYLQRAGDITSTMYSDAFQQAQANQLKSLALAPTSQQAITAPAMQLGALGTAEQARQQQAIDEARARFEFAQQAPDEALTRYSNIAGSNILPGGSTTTSEGGSPSFGQRAVGGTLTGLGVYGGLTASGLAGAANTGALLTTPQGAAVAAAIALASMFD
tara:strand:+ start:789 stop:1691 length:903 start_codon:yes stop_codon:yes gene_type:complete